MSMEKERKGEGEEVREKEKVSAHEGETPSGSFLTGKFECWI